MVDRKRLGSLEAESSTLIGKRIKDKG